MSQKKSSASNFTGLMFSKEKQLAKNKLPKKKSLKPGTQHSTGRQKKSTK